MLEALIETLFAPDDQTVFAVVDGAACDELLGKIQEFRPTYHCLYTGYLALDLQECAPYLIELPPNHAFTDWLLDNATDKPLAIFVRTPADVRAMRRHFRTFLMVGDSANKQIYFRYYDPRVLAAFLPTCDAAQLGAIFGPVTSYFVALTPVEGRRFFIKEGELQSATITEDGEAEAVRAGGSDRPGADSAEPAPEPARRITVRPEQFAVMSEYVFAQFIANAAVVIGEHSPEFQDLEPQARRDFVRSSCGLAEQFGVTAAADQVSFAWLHFKYGEPARWPVPADVHRTFHDPAAEGTHKINAVLDALKAEVAV